MCSRGSPLLLGTRRKRGRGGENPGGAGRGVGSGRGGGRLLAGVGEGFPVVLSGVAIAAGHAHFVRSWVPKDRHPVGAADGCGPRVRALGLRGAGTTYSALCWRILGAPPPGGRRKASPLGSRPLPLHPSAEKSPSLRGFPKQPRVRWKSKGQNPESWLAGPALLLALCRPAGPGAPAGRGQGRVHELHPRNLVGCMDFKPWWLPRQQRRGEGTLLPFHGRICGCPAAWAFS